MASEQAYEDLLNAARRVLKALPQRGDERDGFSREWWINPEYAGEMDAALDALTELIGDFEEVRRVQANREDMQRFLFEEQQRKAART
jgi:hypothetical protein